MGERRRIPDGGTAAKETATPTSDDDGRRQQQRRWERQQWNGNTKAMVAAVAAMAEMGTELQNIFSSPSPTPSSFWLCMPCGEGEGGEGGGGEGGEGGAEARGGEGRSLATRWGVGVLVDDAVHGGVALAGAWAFRLREQVTYAKRGSTRPTLLWKMSPFQFWTSCGAWSSSASPTGSTEATVCMG
eukprot:gene12055-biopygen11137